MKVIYSDEHLVLDKDDVSVFFAGPTPRSKEVKSWRVEALELADRLGFPCVLIPERKNWSVKFDYMNQVEWEYKGLKKCDLIMFWVPRDMQTLPGLTTNVEFGLNIRKRRKSVFYGRPEGSPHTSYLDWLYVKFTGMEPEKTLEGLLKKVNERIGIIFGDE